MGDHLYGMLQHIHAASCFSHHASNAVPGEPRVAFRSLAGVRASDNVAAAESTVREKLDGRNILVVEFDQRSTGASSTRAQCRVHVGRTELFVHLPFVQRLGEFFTNPLNKEPLSLLDPAPAETHQAASQSSSAMDVDVFFRHTVVTLLNHVLGPNMPLLNLTLQDAAVAVAIHECEQDVLQKNGVSCCEKPASLCKEKEKEGDPGRTTVGSSHMMIDAHLPIECLAYNQEKLTYDTLLEPVVLCLHVEQVTTPEAARLPESKPEYTSVWFGATPLSLMVSEQSLTNFMVIQKALGAEEEAAEGTKSAETEAKVEAAKQEAQTFVRSPYWVRNELGKALEARVLGDSASASADGDAMPVPVGATEALRFFRHYEIESGGHGAAAAAAAHHPTSDRSRRLMLTDGIGGDGSAKPGGGGGGAAPRLCGGGRRRRRRGRRHHRARRSPSPRRRGRRRRRRRRRSCPRSRAGGSSS